MNRPFVDYYRELKISPVAQDISDLDRHHQRRDSLYRQLGIPPSALRGANVIEFGPGSGYNALHTAQRQPQRYVLVDVNPTGIAAMRELFAEHVVMDVEIVESMIEDYDADARFDVVLAEGLLPYATDPIALAQTIGSHVESDGVLVITCADSAAALGEVTRRLIARRFADLTEPPYERVAKLLPIFGPHLATLSGMSRSHKDWILDNIVHPFTGRMFSIPDALDSLGDRFDAYGSSPHFVTDWRWYKQIVNDRGYNERTREAFYANVVNFIDYRNELPAHDPALGRRLVAMSDIVYTSMQRSEAGDVAADATAVEQLAQIAEALQTLAPQTARSLEALVAFLRASEPNLETLAPFAPFFGRGMQYLSLIAR